MSGLTLAKESGDTLWVDKETLIDILSDADAKYESTLEEMATYPDIWAEDLAECLAVIQCKRRALEAMIDFMRNEESDK